MRTLAIVCWFLAGTLAFASKDQGSPGGALLISAIESKNIQIVQDALSKVKEINFRDRRDITPLIHAIDTESEDIIRLLLDAGADPDGDFSNIPLALASNAKIARLLIERGAKVDRRGMDGKTPLYWACADQRWEVAKTLLEFGADPNLVGDLDRESYPIHQTVYWSSPEAIAFLKALIAHGADPNKPNHAGQTPLFFAASAEVMETLLDLGANPNYRDPKNGNLSVFNFQFHAYSKQNLPIRIRTLLNHEGNPSLQGQENRTPLHSYFAKTPEDLTDLQAHIKTIQLLLRAGVEVDAVTTRQETPLFNLVKSLTQSFSSRSPVETKILQTEYTILVSQILIHAGADLKTAGTSEKSLKLIANQLNPWIAEHTDPTEDEKYLLLKMAALIRILGDPELKTPSENAKSILKTPQPPRVNPFASFKDTPQDKM